MAAGKKKVRVRVAIAALYHEGNGYVHGQELDVDAVEAKALQEQGAVEPAKK
jgi:hypothetical protein